MEAPGAELQCYAVIRPDADDPTEEIRSAVRRIRFPGYALNVQPDGATLVNIPTIFWTESATVRRSVELLGHDVDVVATPSAYTWVHGDGTSQSTADAGRPYPNKDVTHRYSQPSEAFAARVDTTYTVRFRVDGGAWQDLGQTLTAQGPSRTVAVQEAVPVLVHP